MSEDVCLRHRCASCNEGPFRAATADEDDTGATAGIILLLQR
jgi:hypothetical protein